MPILWTEKAKKILKKYWNYDGLKDKQIEVINELLLGNDIIALLPTGYGKSMCYTLPPLITKKIIFIISPLISLMDEQKEKLLEKKINVVVLHSNNKNRNTDIANVLEGKILIVYMSPEYLILNGLELADKLIKKNLLGYLAIDESHCLSAWGHDFRQSYLQIKKFREIYPDIPIMAVTATATQIVVNEIGTKLLLNNPTIVRCSFDRANLFLKCEIIPKYVKKGKLKVTEQKHTFIVETIKHYINKYLNQKIIIYINSREDTESIVCEINKWNNCSNAYHAGLSSFERDDVLNKFISDEVKVVIATTAFGMGIDQIVRCVLIFGCPKSIEEYWQQIGRGGRDGIISETVLFFDFQKYAMYKILTKGPTKFNILNKLKQMEDFVNTTVCRRRFIIEYFGLGKGENYFDHHTYFCNQCDNCTEKKLVDITKDLYNSQFNNSKTNIIIDKIDYNIINDWKKYITLNNYNIDTLPKKLLIKKYCPSTIDTIETKLDAIDKYADVINKYSL
jgi:RecQ family ATP-dependent DNA helicase